MKQDIEKIIISEEELNNKVKELGQRITADFKEENPILICILRGGAIFMSDLIKQIDTPLEIDFMSVSSYGRNSSSSGIVKIRKDIDVDIQNRHVIIVEDIVDTGLTLDYISDYLKNHNPRSVSICTLLDKPEAHKLDLKIDYTGFKIGNDFVVGYGLDFAEKYRNLPYIGILKKEIYS
ncbi:MAG: hypoxanthine phosphoribosyltransferase [Candidatus Cloacimonas sp. SDB]|nr:MAG: hypoxanthine phosphoribosyltransferase [Candidatus Cloacimonas sp. SDB]